MVCGSVVVVVLMPFITLFVKNVNLKKNNMRKFNWYLTTSLIVTVVLFYFVSSFFNPSLTSNIYLEKVVNILILACIWKNTHDIQKL